MSSSTSWLLRQGRPCPSARRMQLTTHTGDGLLYYPTQHLLQKTSGHTRSPHRLLLPSLRLVAGQLRCLTGIDTKLA